MSLKFSLKRKKIPVEIEDENGVQKKYILQALLGPGRDEYLNITGSKMRLDKEGKPTGIKDFSGMHAQLLSLFLVNEGGERIPAEIVQNWPAEVQSALLTEGQKISGLSDDAGEEAKKD